MVVEDVGDTILEDECGAFEGAYFRMKQMITAGAPWFCTAR